MDQIIKEGMYKLLSTQLSQVKGHIESLEDIINDNISQKIGDEEALIELNAFVELFDKKASYVKQTIHTIIQMEYNS